MIECTKFTSFKKNLLLGFADLFVEKWGVEIRGCKLFQKEGKRWLTLPDREFKTPEGETAYAPIIYFKEMEHLKSFTEEAKKAIDKWCQNNTIVTPQQHQSDTKATPDEDNLPF